MRLIVLFISVLFSSSIFSQTELIAYKSHSGNIDYYKLSGFDNLGNPPMDFFPTFFVDTVFKLNDSTIINSTRSYHIYDSLSVCYKDTVYHQQNSIWLQSSPLDSLPSRLKNGGIVFVGFDTISSYNVDTVSINTEKENLEIIPAKKKNTTPPVAPMTKPNTVSPTSKLYLLWYGLFGVVSLLILSVWYNHKPKLQV